MRSTEVGAYDHHVRLAYAVGGALIGSLIGVVVTFFQARRFCADGPIDSSCGLLFLWWNVRTPVGFALGGLIGAALGGLLGLLVGHLVKMKRSI